LTGPTALVRPSGLDRAVTRRADHDYPRSRDVSCPGEYPAHQCRPRTRRQRDL